MSYILLPIRLEMKRKKVQIFKYICGLVSMLGLMYLFGVAGGVDTGSMNEDLAAIHGIIGLAIFGLFAWIGGFFSED